MRLQVDLGPDLQVRLQVYNADGFLSSLVHQDICGELHLHNVLYNGDRATRSYHSAATNSCRHKTRTNA